MTTTCVLCGMSLKPREADRFAGMDLCNPCFEARNADAWRARGFTLAERHWKSGAEHPSRWTEVHGAGARPLPVTASFTMETGGIRAGKFFGMKKYKGELQTGDAAFDRLVYIETEQPAALAPLLRQEALRDTLTEMLQLVMQLTIDPDGVRIPYCHNWSKPPAHHEIVRGVVLLLHLVGRGG
jgi:hypothetical protein